MCYRLAEWPIAFLIKRARIVWHNRGTSRHCLQCQQNGTRRSESVQRPAGDALRTPVQPAKSGAPRTPARSLRWGWRFPAAEDRFWAGFHAARGATTNENEHRTSNPEHPTSNHASGVGWSFSVRCSMLDVRFGASLDRAPHFLVRMGGGWRETFGVRELAPAFSREGAKSAGKPPHSKRFAFRPNPCFIRVSSAAHSVFGSAS
jgi:hypothetical protein